MESSTEPQNQELNEVLSIINALALKSVNADYIFRGETQCYDKVSSSLYREHPNAPDIELIQQADLEEAQKYTFETDEFAILTELQHYGGKTNLIDFTADYLIALFFACDGDYSQEGRVVLLKRTEERNEHIYGPRHPVNRVLAQKSIFVRPPDGYIDPDDTVFIPTGLKVSMLDYLHKGHGISTETIYNDLLGFIRSRTIHREANRIFSTALGHQRNSDYEGVIEWCGKALGLNPRMAAAYYVRGNANHDKDELDQAIEDYTRAIELDPEYAVAYIERGVAYYDKGELDRAIENYNRAIELDPDYAGAYYGRGNAHYEKEELDQAIEDHTRAIELDPEEAGAYFGRGNAYYEKGELDRAIENYNQAIELDPHPVLYNWLGIAYHYKGEFDRAIESYNRAIELDPEYADPYGNLGEAWMHLSEWGKARGYLSTALELGMDIVGSFHAEYEGFADFEQRTGLTLPGGIAEMLGG